MVPFADYVNHENVDTGFDCVDIDGNSFEPKKSEEEDRSAYEKWRAQSNDTRDAVFSMKTELLEMEIGLRAKMQEGGHVTQSQAEQQDQAMDLKLMQRVQSAMKKEKDRKKDDDDNYSSGLSSDNEIDMLVEQEMLRERIKAKQKPQ